MGTWFLNFIQWLKQFRPKTHRSPVTGRWYGYSYRYKRSGTREFKVWASSRDEADRKAESFFVMLKGQGAVRDNNLYPMT